jgi:3'-5' exonuclease
MNTLAFDIETVPDVSLGRRLYGLEGLGDAEVAKAMFTLRRQRTGDEFLPHAQQRIVAVSCVLRSRDGVRLWSLGDPTSSESELLERFFDGIERFSPVLVSWNGCGFDLPVLHYRGLRAGVRAARYWETGDEDVAFRYNNYLGRYHWRHIDLMDVLAGYQHRARASLADTAALVGLPGKLGFDGSQVWEAWLAGDIVRIRRYCETDVLNTYLIYVRFELLRGRLTRERYAEEIERVKAWLRGAAEPHYAEFLQAWERSAAEAAI